MNLAQKLSRYSLNILGLVCLAAPVYSQSWVPSSEGLLQTFQNPGAGPPFGLEVKFVPNGPLGRDWIYGSWLDTDSLKRSVGYREGGKWVHLPFHMTRSSYTTDIAQYGDTMYIAGYFDGIVLDKDSSSLPTTEIIKYYNDSIWAAPYNLFDVQDLEVSGDSLLVWATAFEDASDTILGYHLLTTDGGATWEYPYSIAHPTEPTGAFGAWVTKLAIRNGSVYSLNDATHGHFNGVVKWDGQQWHGFGNGIYGTFSKAYDFEFYKDELYMAGSFSRSEDPRNPGQYIAKWNGNDWENVGGSVNSAVLNTFTYDNLLFCRIVQDKFGDVQIPYLAAWNGVQWCGTPMNYSGAHPHHFGFINDTLFVSYKYLPATANGQSLSYINYFDGDYVNGPNSICSTLGLSNGETRPGNAPLQVFPVPAKGEVQVSLPDEGIQNLKVYDLSGRCVLEFQPMIPETTIDISSLLPGIYLLQINEKYNGKIIKE